jgi:hypothetical protein
VTGKDIYVLWQFSHFCQAFVDEEQNRAGKYNGWRPGAPITPNQTGVTKSGWFQPSLRSRRRFNQLILVTPESNCHAESLPHNQRQENLPRRHQRLCVIGVIARVDI